MNTSETTPEARKAILELVESQIQQNDAPEARQTLKRLRAEGHSADEARRLIACCVSVEIFHMARDHEPYNRDRFILNLSRLPKLPWDEKEEPVSP